MNTQLTNLGRFLAARAVVGTLKYCLEGYCRPVAVTCSRARAGWNVNPKRVLRLMSESALLVQRRRRFVRTTDSDHGLHVFSNLLAEFTPTGIDQVCV